MAKTGFPAAGPAGLADWLPLLGAICQVLASLGEEDEAEAAKAAGPKAATAERSQASGKSGR